MVLTAKDIGDLALIAISDIFIIFQFFS